MVALSQDDGFVDVTRVETADVALGGNEINVPNKQFVELASRDQWLKEELESRTGSDATAIQSFERSRDLSQASIAQGRLTLATGAPTPSTDQTAATTLYYTPFNGDLVSLWNGAESRWDVNQFTERSLSLSGLAANANYDIFLWDDGGTLTLESVGWSNSGAGTSARASAISRRNGVWVKTSDDRRYLGTIRTTGVAGQCEDSELKRFVWNVQNRRQVITYTSFGNNYTYSGSERFVGGSEANTASYAVFGLADLPLDFLLSARCNSDQEEYRLYGSINGASNLGDFRKGLAWDGIFGLAKQKNVLGYNVFSGREAIESGGNTSVATVIISTAFDS